MTSLGTWWGQGAKEAAACRKDHAGLCDRSMVQMPLSHSIKYFFKKCFPPLKAWHSHSQAESKRGFGKRSCAQLAVHSGGGGHLQRPRPEGLGEVSELPSPTICWMGTRHQALGAGAAPFTQLCTFPSADVPSLSLPSFYTLFNTTGPWAGDCSKGSRGPVRGLHLSPVV